MRYLFYKVGLKLKILLSQFGFKPTFKSYGFKIKTYNLSTYGQVEYAQWLHPAESNKMLDNNIVNELKNLINEGDFCIDIGAHTGDTTVPMALVVGKKGCVLALEPNKHVYSILEKNANLNKDHTNIIPLMAAATLDDGKYEFCYMDPGYCNGGFYKNAKSWKLQHNFKLEVKGLNLSKKLRADYSDRLHELKYIKIDTEGYDLFVLRSIEDLIDEFSPHVKAEVINGSSFEYRNELYSFFVNKGYLVCKAIDDGNLIGCTITEEDLLKWTHYDIFCIPEKNRHINLKNSHKLESKQT